jgi:hypothetical protein
VATPIQLDSLSNHQVVEGEHVYGYGSGFVGVTGVQVGNQWAPDFRVDGATIVTFTIPHGAGGATEWVIVHGADGTSSPCVGEGQRVTYGDPLAAPTPKLKLDSLTPDTITVGRGDSYWLLGAGLSHVSVVQVGHSGILYETHDDDRMILHLPDELRVDAGATHVTITLHRPDGGSATLSVPCITIKDATDTGPPAVLSVDPNPVPSAGGRLTIHGGGFQEVKSVTVGPVEATIESAHPDVLVVSVGDLSAHLGSRLGVQVITAYGQNWPIDNSDHVTVTH